MQPPSERKFINANKLHFSPRFSQVKCPTPAATRRCETAERVSSKENSIRSGCVLAKEKRLKRKHTAPVSQTSSAPQPPRELGSVFSHWRRTVTFIWPSGGCCVFQQHHWNNSSAKEYIQRVEILSLLKAGEKIKIKEVRGVKLWIYKPWRGSRQSLQLCMSDVWADEEVCELLYFKLYGTFIWDNSGY